MLPAFGRAANAHTAGRRGAGDVVVAVVSTGRPSRIRADQKWPHGQTYHAIVSVLSGMGGTSRLPHAGQVIASASNGLAPVMFCTDSNSRAERHAAPGAVLCRICR